MKEKNYYVVCPSNVVTGGPDALHQMCHYMNRIGLPCKMAYIADRLKGLEIPEPYRVYVSECCLLKEIEDRENNVLILAETDAHLSARYQNAMVYIWWLSVDNNVNNESPSRKWFRLVTTPVRALKHPDLYRCSAVSKAVNAFRSREYSFENEKKNIIHLCASYYAYDYVTRRSKNPVYRCIEPISSIFLERYKNDQTTFERNDTVLFNPKKSGDFVDLVKQRYPGFAFKPLVNMPQSELITAYKQAKLYVDFGPFPGAERIPKEAVLYGCLIITGRHGASGYHGDVPIPDTYKFDEDTQMEAILRKMRDCLENYDACYDDFNEYRDTVLHLEDRFLDSLRSVFGDRASNENG